MDAPVRVLIAAMKPSAVDPTKKRPDAEKLSARTSVRRFTVNLLRRSGLE